MGDHLRSSCYKRTIIADFREKQYLIFVQSSTPVMARHFD